MDSGEVAAGVVVVGQGLAVGQGQGLEARKLLISYNSFIAIVSNISYTVKVFLGPVLETNHYGNGIQNFRRRAVYPAQ